jgi:hypothetical protein
MLRGSATPDPAAARTRPPTTPRAAAAAMRVEALWRVSGRAMSGRRTHRVPAAHRRVPSPLHVARGDGCGDAGPWTPAYSPRIVDVASRGRIAAWRPMVARRPFDRHVVMPLPLTVYRVRAATVPSPIHVVPLVAVLATAVLALSGVQPARAQPATAPADTAPATADAGVEDSAATRRVSGTRVRRARAGWEVTPFVGYATRSPVRFWGLTPGRNHLMVGVQLAHTIWRAGTVTLAYAPNVVPLFVLTNNPEAGGIASRPAGGDRRLHGRMPSPSCEGARCGPVLGVAAAPVGLRLDVGRARGVRVYGAAAAGAVVFDRNVPVREARRLNATAEWGGGAVVGTGAAVAVQVGYKYHHLSNAYTAARNPGVDGRVVYGGLQWRLGGGSARR